MEIFPKQVENMILHSFQQIIWNRKVQVDKSRQSSKTEMIELFGLRSELRSVEKRPRMNSAQNSVIETMSLTFFVLSDATPIEFL